MVVNILRTLLLVLIPSLVWGQSLELSVSSATSDNSTSTFLLQEGEVRLTSRGLQFQRTGTVISGFEVYGVSPDYSTVSVLKRTGSKGQILLFSSRGDTLNAYPTVTLQSSDPSLAVYPSNSGKVLLRDNITNFTFYDTFGEIITNMSSSSQSKRGEAISEVAMSPGGETVVIYNPKIKRSGGLGSKAEVMLAGGKFETIYQENDRYIKKMAVSDDGNLVVTVTAQEGTDDQVLIMDKYGNELNTLSSGEDLLGAALSDDAEYITLYSRGRVMVYSVMSGERIGRASLRSPVFLADYFPEDDMILVLGGDYSQNGGTLNNVEFRAIDVEQREIESAELSGGELGFDNALKPELQRVSANEYRLTGASKQVTISADF